MISKKNKKHNNKLSKHKMNILIASFSDMSLKSFKRIFHEVEIIYFISI